MSWPDGERYSRHLQFLVVFLLLSLVSTLLFSRTGGVLSHLNFSTHRLPRFSPRNLCSLVMLAVLFRLRCNGHSLLSSCYVSRNGRVENPSCSACGYSSQDTSHLILHCPAMDLCAAHSLAALYLLTTSGADPGELPASGAPWSSAMPPSLGRDRVTITGSSEDPASLLNPFEMD